MKEVDKIIFDLFSERWVGESVTKNIDSMKKQLFKNLNDQVNGYWSGHTAYDIMVDGGFLVDAKHKSPDKKLTKLGLLFTKSMIFDK